MTRVRNIKYYICKKIVGIKQLFKKCKISTDATENLLLNNKAYVNNYLPIIPRTTLILYTN